jgi:hypothetical protein
MRLRDLFVGVIVIATFIAADAVAQSERSGVLDTIEPGLWSLRLRNGNGQERMCVAHGRGLVQLRHSARHCRQLVVASDEDEVTVQYSCGEEGFGRTRLRVESPRLVQIEAQGVARGAPFALAAEARRIGSCKS